MMAKAVVIKLDGKSYVEFETIHYAIQLWIQKLPELDHSKLVNKACGCSTGTKKYILHEYYESLLKRYGKQVP